MTPKSDKEIVEQELRKVPLIFRDNARGTWTDFGLSVAQTTKLATLKDVLKDLNNIYLCSETNYEFFRKVSHLKENIEAKIKEAEK